MTRLVREVAEVRECGSLGELIDRLVRIRDGLPDPSRADAQMRGDDVFGRFIAVSYLREQTEEEAERDARYSDAYLRSLRAKLARVQAEVDLVSAARRLHLAA